MGRGSTFVIPYKRRRQARTHYRERRKLIVSSYPIYIVRRSLRYITVTFTAPRIGGDIHLAGASSKELLKRYNWVSGRNLPAAYLTGLLAGLRAKEKGIERASLSLGIAWTTSASIPFAAAQGSRDAGIEIPMGEEAKRDHDRVRGVHIAQYAKALKDKSPEAYSQRFSRYLALGEDPEDLPERFEEVKKMILEGA
jgi:large subunit ribosomal protein L18